MSLEISSNTTLSKKADVSGRLHNLLNKINLKSPGNLPNLVRLSQGPKY